MSKVADRQPKLTAVRLDLDREEHRLLRLSAAYADTSMTLRAREIVATHVRKEAKERGDKE